MAICTSNKKILSSFRFVIYKVYKRCNNYVMIVTVFIFFTKEIKHYQYKLYALPPFSYFNVSSFFVFFFIYILKKGVIRKLKEKPYKRQFSIATYLIPITNSLYQIHLTTTISFHKIKIYRGNKYSVLSFLLFIYIYNLFNVSKQQRIKRCSIYIYI